jgi:hypothetical protein
MMRSVLLPLTIFSVLSCSPLRTYQQDPDVLAWEGDIRKFEHLDSTETYPDDAILFAGSSSIRLWETLARDISPYPVIQRGYGGAKLSDLAIYAGRIFYPHKCRAIVMFIANDIAGNEDDKSPGEVDRLFRIVLKTIRDKYPVTPVFWIAVTPTALRWEVWPEIEEANRLIEASCLENDNTYYIRTDFAFLNDSFQPKEELFLPDRLHLNAKGYEVWTEIIKKELKKVLPLKDTVPRCHS